MHGLDEIIRFRMLMIAAGYEDGNDADSLRTDPLFKLRDGPAAGTRRSVLAIHHVAHREPARRARPAAHGPRHGRLLLPDLPPGAAPHRARHRRHLRRRAWRPAASPVQRASRRIRLSADRRVRRRGPHDHRPPAPRLPADRATDRVLAAPPDRGAARQLAACRDPAARRQPLLHPGSAALLPCRAARLRPRRGADHHPAQAYHRAGSTARPRAPPRRTARSCAASRNSTTAPQAGIASSASSPASRPGRRASTHASSSPASTVFAGRTVYQDIYCARGQAENHIKAWKTHLAADRTSCCRAAANQMRLFLHVGAYWLMWSLRAAMPRHSLWRVAQFDTLRLRLIKLAARVEALNRKVRLHLPRSTPNQPIFACALPGCRECSPEQRSRCPVFTRSHQPQRRLH